MTPRCPECDADLVFEDPYWYCGTCDNEYMPEDIGLEESEDEES